jgi:hypothetical protein
LHVTILAIEAIIAAKEVQSRAEFNEEHAKELAEPLKRGELLKPVVVFFDGEKYWLASGFHRLRAHVLIGLRYIRVEIRCGTMRDAILFSVGCNATHGLRRTNEDKNRAVTMLLIDKEWGNWSNNRIAEACGVSHTFVSRVRAEMTSNGFKFDVRRETANGTIIDTSRIGKTSQLKAVPRTILDQIHNRFLIIDKIVDHSPFDPDEMDELDEEIAKVQEELKAMRQAMKSKRMQLSTLEAKRQRLMTGPEPLCGTNGTNFPDHFEKNSGMQDEVLANHG